jgi:hypothetical protein
MAVVWRQSIEYRQRMARHLTLAELEDGLPEILRAPKDRGLVRLIVSRPEHAQREQLTTAELDPIRGLVGDNWSARGSSRTTDGSAHPEMQLTLMNARVIALVAQEELRWSLAGDQLYVDMDLSVENLPPGTRLRAGSAVVEITPTPHTGCKKFVSRFGVDALKFVSTPTGKQLRLRGVNARVVEPGELRVGDALCRDDSA